MQPANHKSPFKKYSYFKYNWHACPRLPVIQSLFAVGSSGGVLTVLSNVATVILQVCKCAYLCITNTSLQVEGESMVISPYIHNVGTYVISTYICNWMFCPDICCHWVLQSAGWPCRCIDYDISRGRWISSLYTIIVWYLILTF